MLETKSILLANASSCSKIHPHMSKGHAVYSHLDSTLDFVGLRRFIKFFHNVRYAHHNAHTPIYLDLGKVEFIDKLTVILLECIVFSIIYDYGHLVTVNFSAKLNIRTGCANYTPLLNLQYGAKRCPQFQQQFMSDMSLNHYRTIVKQGSSKSDRLSVITTDLCMFLSHSSIKEDYGDNLAEVISELITNADEHNEADCLVDIDITSIHKKPGSDDSYIGVNVAIASFSNVAFEKGIKEKINNGVFESSRYFTVLDALANHRSFFCEDYTEDDFFRIAAFQNKISGRKNSSTTGGTGLTTLLKSLEEMSDSAICYFLSSGRALFFNRAYLEYDRDGWVGFNKEKDFINHPPETGILRNSPLIIPGTAYNLNYVYKLEE